MDPLAVDLNDQSPYSYVGNNLLNFIDSDGMQYNGGSLNPSKWGGPTGSFGNSLGFDSPWGVVGQVSIGSNGVYTAVKDVEVFSPSHTTFENFSTLRNLQTNPLKGATISQWQPNGYDKWKSIPYVGKLTYGIFDDAYVTVRSIFWPGGEVTHLNGDFATPREMQSAFAFTAASFLPIGKGTTAAKEIVENIAKKGIVEVGEKAGVKQVAEQTAVHGNSLKSMRPTWGYKLYSTDGTFLKNGITSKVMPESRYTRAFMMDKKMIPIKQFPNRIEAWLWEFEQNNLLRGPLNKNMH